jgi:hypothetical protein
MMHDHGKSDSAIVAVKPTNNAGQPGAEPWAGNERNAGEQSTHRTQGRTRVTQGLARVGKACRQVLEVGAVCPNWARTDLYGGRLAIAVPTANDTHRDDSACTGTVVRKPSHNQK